MGIGCKDLRGLLSGARGKRKKKRERAVAALERLCGGMTLSDGERMVFVCGRNGTFWKFFALSLRRDLAHA